MDNSVSFLRAYDGSAPSIQELYRVQAFKDESQWWLSAGAKGLAALDRIVVVFGSAFFLVRPF
jgi:hypothetical protein